jgi:diguanylate cyclase (GGDEF)-like protein
MTLEDNLNIDFKAACEQNGINPDDLPKAFVLEVSRLYDANDSLKMKLDLDGGTGLYNKSKFSIDLNERICAAQNNSKRNDDPSKEFYLGVLDLNNFKGINDRFGHVSGDYAISAFGDILKREAEQYNAFAYRIGGDEFAIIGDGTFEHSEALARDIRNTCAKTLLVLRDGNITEYRGIDISIGIAHYSPGFSADFMCNLADDRMYEDKKYRKSGIRILEIRNLTDREKARVAA